MTLWRWLRLAFLTRSRRDDGIGCHEVTVQRVAEEVSPTTPFSHAIPARRQWSRQGRSSLSAPRTDPYVRVYAYGSYEG